MATDLLDRVPGWEREAARFEEKARALRQMIDAVRVLNGDVARLFGIEVIPRATNQHGTEEGPRGRDAVRRITVERPGVWLVKEIKRVNRDRGWPSSDTSIETAVARLHKAGEATKVPGKGAYRFGQSPEMPDESPARSLAASEDGA